MAACRRELLATQEAEIERPAWAKRLAILHLTHKLSIVMHTCKPSYEGDTG
jgi:hypothetical protein